MNAAPLRSFRLLLLTAVLLFTCINIGAQWTNIYNPGTFYRLKFVNSNIGYTQDIYGMKKTVDGGTTWTTIDSNPTTYVRTDMYWLNANDGFVIFYENLGFGNYAGWFKKTSNGGATWTAMQQLPYNEWYSAVWFTSSTIGYVAGSNGRLLKTTNGGTSWTQLNSGTSEDLYSIFFVSATTAYIGGDNGIILKTTNSGTSWVQQFSSIFWEFNDLWFTDPNNGMAVGTYGMMRTTNGGASWTAITGLPVTQFNAVMFPSADTGYVSAVGGAVLRTVDGGISWLALNQVGTGGYFVRDVYFVSNDTGYVAADYTGIWKTTVAGTGCPSLVLNYNAIAGPDTIRGCAGNNVTFTVAASAMNPYLFTFSPAANVAHNYGNYYYASNTVPGDTLLIVATLVDTITGCASVSDSIVLITDSVTYQPVVNGPTILLYLCPGDSLVLDAGAGAQDGYLWQSVNQTTQTITVDTVGMWQAIAYACGTTHMTIYLVQWNTNCNFVCDVDAGPDTTFCQQHGQLNAVPASPGNYIFSWSPATGLDNPNIQNPTVDTGVSNQTYVVTMTDTVNNCTATDTVIINAYYFHIDTSYSCNNSPVTLDFGPGASNYFWQFYTDPQGNTTPIFNQSGQTYMVTQPGSYGGIAMFPGCGALTSIFWVVDTCTAAVCAVDAGPDTMYCQQHGQLNAIPASPGNYTFSWSPSTGLDNPNVQNPNVISGVHNQQYVVTMTDTANNCIATDTVIISAYYFHLDTLYMCNNQPVTIDLGPGGSNYTVQFTDTAGNFHYLQFANGIYTATQPAQYLFIAFYPGCGALTSVITVLDSCNVYVPNVWPGDCNYDLTANMADALHIGLAYNATGATRPNATNGWYAQPMADWSQNFANCNYKHADADGNGTVNVNDTLPISLNYSQTHPFRLQPQVAPLTAPTLELIANYDTVGLQTLVTVDIRLGSASVPVDSIYGISFRITSDALLIDTMLTVANLNNTWLGTPGSNMFHFRKYFANAAVMDIAECGTDHLNRTNGSGSIGSFLIVTTDNLSGIAICHFDLSDVTVVTASQHYVVVNTIGDSVVIDPAVPAGIEPVAAQNTFAYYPNPANNQVTVQTSALAERIEICDMTGRVISTTKPNSTTATIETSTLAQGVYLLRVYNGNAVSTQKLTISH